MDEYGIFVITPDPDLKNEENSSSTHVDNNENSHEHIQKTNIASKQETDNKKKIDKIEL